MYIIGIDPTDTRTADQGPAFALGSLGTTSNGTIYKYLKYDGGAGSIAAAAFNVAYYDTLDGYKLFTCTSDLSDSIEIGAGVLQAVIASGEYGWVQIKGPATITPALTAGADGNALTAVGATDGTLDVSALVTDAVVAYAIDASAKIIMCDFPF